MEISEYIYKGIAKPYHEKPTRAYANRAGHSRKMRGESNSSNTYSNISESASKRSKRCVDRLNDISKTTCIVHGPRKSSDEC